MDERHTGTQNVLDRTAIDRLVDTCGDGGAGMVACLLKTFLDEMPQLLAGLDRAVGDGDDQEIRRIGHTLKGHGATFGAPFMGHLAFELEVMGRTGRLDGAVQVAAELGEECRRVAAELRITRTELIGACR